MEVINYLLGYKKIKIYQNTDYFNFSLDSVLLPNFVTISKKAKKILDIGTGNAVIPLILTQKTKAHIDAVELQKEVYDLAVKSVKYNKLENQISIINDDIKKFSNFKPSDQYDIITCNPPFFEYNKLSKLNKNVIKTIARHEITIKLEDIIKISGKLLKNDGVLAIVHRTDRLIEIIELMRKYNIKPKKIRLVYPKYSFDSNIVLIEGTKNGKKKVKIMYPLVVHNKDGTYTDEVKKYFENNNIEK